MEVPSKTGEKRKMSSASPGNNKGKKMKSQIPSPKGVKKRKSSILPNNNLDKYFKRTNENIDNNNI